jgi:hypothetical protein
MYEWLRKIHMYAGLLSLTAFVVWGVAGVHGAFLPAPGQSRLPAPTGTRVIPYDAPGDLDDPALARRIFEVSGVTMTYPPNNSRRDKNQDLTFILYSPNGRRDVTYLEREHLIRIEIRQNKLAGFLSSMHTGRTGNGLPDLPARVWGFYNEFSVWAFFFLIFSGLYLWLATRPRLRWAWMTAAAAVTAFAALWVAL